MDEKKERSLSRIREEIAIYEPILETIITDPGETDHLHIPILKNLLYQHYKTIECVEQDKPFLASQFTNPVEILTAMDIHWYFHIQQLFAASGSGPGLHAIEDLEAADNLAVPKDCCTLIRLGMYLQVAGLLPIPTVYLAITEPCDSVTGWHSVFMHHPDWRNVPAFAPDPPYKIDEDSIKYYADELRLMVEFITKHTGKTLKFERLQEVVDETNKGYALWMEYDQLRRSKPTPHSYVLPLSCFFQLNTLGSGNPDKTEWYKDMVADAEMRIRENRPQDPKQKIRVFWYDVQPFYFGEITQWLQDEWEAAIAMDMTSYCSYSIIDTSTEDSLFRGLAKRSFQDGPMIHQGRGLVDNVVNDITNIVKDYQIDCVIFPGHMGHKDMAASSSIMRDVCREIDVPFLYIGLDIADPRYTTVDEIKDKISHFFKAMGLA